MATGMSGHHRKVESLTSVLRLHALNGDKGLALKEVLDEADEVYDWIAEGPTERNKRRGKDGAL